MIAAIPTVPRTYAFSTTTTSIMLTRPLLNPAGVSLVSRQFVINMQIAQSSRISLTFSPSSPVMPSIRA